MGIKERLVSNNNARQEEQEPEQQERQQAETKLKDWKERIALSNNEQFYNFFNEVSICRSARI